LGLLATSSPHFKYQLSVVEVLSVFPQRTSALNGLRDFRLQTLMNNPHVFNF
jgi:hypothetical protein